MILCASLLALFLFLYRLVGPMIMIAM